MVNGCIMSDAESSDDSTTSRFHQITSSNGLCYYNRLLGDILPNRDEWKCAYKLPFGWEMAIHSTGRVYYLNHINQEVSWKRPGVCSSTTNHIAVLPIQSLEKQVELFIVNRKVERMLASTEKKTSSLKVKKRFFHNLRTNKKKKHNKVRFEEVVHENNNNGINNSEQIYTNWNPQNNHHQQDIMSTADDVKEDQMMDMVLGTFDLHMEDDRDQVQVFRYYANTTASDLLLDACNQRQLCSRYFALVMITSANLLESKQESFGTIATIDDDVIIAPWDLIAEVAVNPRFFNHRCRLRLTYIPKDIHQMARDDTSSFIYLYRQSLHDVICRPQLQSELSEEKLMELRAIELVETCLYQQIQEEEDTLAKKPLLDLRKSMIKFLEKKSSDVSFMPHSTSDMQSLRKTLHQKTKSVMDESFVSASAFDEKLKKLRIDYLKILSPCHYFGGCSFDSVIQGKNDYYVTLVVGRHYGVSQLINPKTRMLSVFATFKDILTLDVAPHNDQQKTNIRVELKKMAPLLLSLDTRQAVTFALLIYGYCRLKLNDSMMLILPVQQFFNSSPDLPNYHDLHRVFRSGWNDPCPPDDTAAASSLYLCKFSSKLNLISETEIPMLEREAAQQGKTETNGGTDETNNKNLTDDSSSASTSSSEDEEESNNSTPPVRMRSHTTVDGASTLPTSSTSASQRSSNRMSTFKPGQPLADAVTPSSSSQPHVVGAELTWGEDDGFDSDNGSLKKRRSKFFSISRKSSKRSYSINDVSGEGDNVKEKKKKNFVRNVFSRPKSFKKMSRLYSAPDGEKPNVITRLFSRIRRHQSSYDLNTDDGADGQRYFSLDGTLDMTQSNTLPRKAKDVDGRDFHASSEVGRRKSEDGMISPPSEASPSVKKATKKQKMQAPKVPVKEETPKKEDSVSDISQEAPKEKDAVSSVSQEAPKEEDSVSNISQESPKEKDTVSDISQEAPKEKDTVSDISQEAPKEKDTVSDISQEAPKEKDAVSNISQEAPKEEDAVSSVSQEAPKEEDSVSDISQESPKEEDSVSDISQEAPKEEDTVSDISQEAPKEEDTVSDISQEAPREEDTVSDISQEAPREEDTVSDISQEAQKEEQSSKEVVVSLDAQPKEDSEDKGEKLQEDLQKDLDESHVDAPKEEEREEISSSSSSSSDEDDSTDHVTPPQESVDEIKKEKTESKLEISQVSISCVANDTKDLDVELDRESALDSEDVSQSESKVQESDDSTTPTEPHKADVNIKVDDESDTESLKTSLGESRLSFRVEISLDEVDSKPEASVDDSQTEDEVKESLEDSIDVTQEDSKESSDDLGTLDESKFTLQVDSSSPEGSKDESIGGLGSQLDESKLLLSDDYDDSIQREASFHQWDDDSTTDSLNKSYQEDSTRTRHTSSSIEQTRHDDDVSIVVDDITKVEEKVNLEEKSDDVAEQQATDDVVDVAVNTPDDVIDTSSSSSSDEEEEKFPTNTTSSLVQMFSQNISHDDDVTTMDKRSSVGDDVTAISFPPTPSSLLSGADSTSTTATRSGTTDDVPMLEVTRDDVTVTSLGSFPSPPASLMSDVSSLGDFPPPLPQLTFNSPMPPPPPAVAVESKKKLNVDETLNKLLNGGVPQEMVATKVERKTTKSSSSSANIYGNRSSTSSSMRLSSAIQKSPTYVSETSSKSSSTSVQKRQQQQDVSRRYGNKLYRLSKSIEMDASSSSSDKKADDEVAVATKRYGSRLYEIQKSIEADGFDATRLSASKSMSKAEATKKNLDLMRLSPQPPSGGSSPTPRSPVRGVSPKPVEAAGDQNGLESNERVAPTKPQSTIEQTIKKTTTHEAKTTTTTSPNHQPSKPSDGTTARVYSNLMSPRPFGAGQRSTNFQLRGSTFNTTNNKSTE